MEEHELKEIEVISQNKRKPIKYEVDKNGCWNCISHRKNEDGYPKIKINNKYISVHRYIYEKNFGKIPKGLLIRHRCDNPACINIKHLKIGTQQDNMNDKVERHRQSKLKGELHGRSKLTQNQIIKIRKDVRSQRTISEEYGVSHQHISLIKNMKAWGSL